jgi:hypothetical protein
MNNRMKHISSEIRKGNLLEENIPQLFNYLANQYYSYAGVRLSMHYYAFYEAFCDDEDIWSIEAKEITSKLNHIIQNYILQSKSGKERMEAVQSVDAIRNEIMKRMNMLTIYTDMFQIYEYVLNRVEYRFKQSERAVVDEEFARDILRYIFDTQDNLVINEKIREIIGQLPLRMTKQKYFDLLKDSLHVYLGSDRSSLDTYLYMLRTSATLYREDGMDTYYPILWEKKEYLSGLSYKDLTKAEYEKALSALRIATLMLETETTVYYSLQEIVNEVYALLLCSSYEGMASSDYEEADKAAFTIIREINIPFTESMKHELALEVLEQFTKIEGVQEELADELSRLEDALYDIDNNHRKLAESLMLDTLLRVLLHSRKLLSNSLFINLDETTIEETVDELRMEEEISKLIGELTKLFEEQDRMIGRAVMANTINKMPVFFKDHKEVMDYVLYSLERCSDSSEKSACVEIIQDIMKEE